MKIWERKHCCRCCSISCHIVRLRSNFSDKLRSHIFKSGIVLPGQAKEKPQEAEVIAVGPGGNIDGKEVVMQVNVGDKVIYSKYAGTDVELDKEEYIIVKQSDIHAIVTE